MDGDAGTAAHDRRLPRRRRRHPGNRSPEVLGEFAEDIESLARL